MMVPRLERAIGVIYRPQTERRSHYFHAHLGEQFDAVIHLDNTRAVEPLERTSLWDEGSHRRPIPAAFDDGYRGLFSGKGRHQAGPRTPGSIVNPQPRVRSGR